MSKGKYGFRRQHGNTPRNNQAQNEQTKAVAKALGLTPAQRERLHRVVSKQGLHYQEILEVAKDLFNKR